MALHHRLIGKAASLYWRVRKPRTLGVRAIVIDPYGQVALVRHTYTDQWYLPGGGVKKGESFETALRRELKEELAFGGGKVERVLGIYHSRNEAKDDHIIIFVVRVEDDRAVQMQKADLMEIEEVRWFPLDELPPDISLATRRRIAEYQANITGLGAW